MNVGKILKVVTVYSFEFCTILYVIGANVVLGVFPTVLKYYFSLISCFISPNPFLDTVHFTL